MFTSDDGARRWKRVSEPDAAVHFGFPIAADDNDGQTAWVVPLRSDQQRMSIDGGLFVARTTDGGASWQSFRDLPPRPRRARRSRVLRHHDRQRVCVGGPRRELDLRGQQPAARSLSALRLIPQVALTRHLQRFFPTLKVVEEIPGGTVRELLDELERRFPGFAAYIVDETGRLRRHVNIFVREEPIFDRDALADEVAIGDRVHILQALSGG